MTLQQFGADLLSDLGSKELVAQYLGYLPASEAFFFKDTYGIPIVDQAITAHKNGLRMDWGGIALEFARHGQDGDAEIAEARRFMETFA